MTWRYGLMEENGALVLSEIYFDKKDRCVGYVVLHQKNVKKVDIPLIGADVMMQLFHRQTFKVDEKAGKQYFK